MCTTLNTPAFASSSWPCQTRLAMNEGCQRRCTGACPAELAHTQVRHSIHPSACRAQSQPTGGHYSPAATPVTTGSDGTLHLSTAQQQQLSGCKSD
mmetsp:Transcript_4478/g.11148  ORF Transcript_4478/g.11148 Transcript_4478/m.11148 type:complete len:96 (-) Transcript_4478:234-521(-)